MYKLIVCLRKKASVAGAWWVNKMCRMGRQGPLCRGKLGKEWISFPLQYKVWKIFIWDCCAAVWRCIWGGKR